MGKKRIIPFLLTVALIANTVALNCTHIEVFAQEDEPSAQLTQVEDDQVEGLEGLLDEELPGEETEIKADELSDETTALSSDDLSEDDLVDEDYAPVDDDVYEDDTVSDEDAVDSASETLLKSSKDDEDEDLDAEEDKNGKKLSKLMNGESGTCGDNLVWEIVNDELIISGTGKMDDFNNDESLPPWRNYVFSKVTIRDGVTSIGDYAFCNNSNITSISLPDTMESIGGWAFYGCRGLTCITIPEGVTKLGKYVFESSVLLEKVILPKSLSTIGGFMFGSNPLLKSAGYKGSGCNIEFAWDETIPDNAFYGCADLTKITIPDSVTTIGNSAFSQCYGLTRITLPESVTTIGDSAFANSYGLEEITIPEGVTTIGKYAFTGCAGLTEITLSDSVTTIGNSAFYGCSGLTEITIPEGVTTIGYNAFSKCDSLEKVILPKSLSTINGGWYGGIFESDPLLKTAGYKGSGCNIEFAWDEAIPDRAFCECYYLTEITIPEGVTTIGYNAFSKCDSLEKVILPKSLSTINGGWWYGGIFKSDPLLKTAGYKGSGCNIEFAWDEAIPDRAFCYCTGLTEITIPNSVTTIGYSAFSGCSGLTEITIPDSVTTIGDSAFSGCSGLTEITIPDSVTTIGDSAFSGCSGLTEITIPDSVTAIENEAFYNCYGLTKISISDSVTTIGRQAFWGCSGLTEITIPSSVTSIGDRAFSECYYLTEITIPGSVTTIGDEAFSYCWELSRITIAEGVTNIGKYAFCDCYSLEKVVLPKSLRVIDDACDEGMFSGNPLLKTAGCIGSGCNIEYAWDEAFPDNAFYGCTSLAEITIPASVTKFGTGAFNRCGALKDIYYGGIELQWCRISNMPPDMIYKNDPVIHFKSSSGTWGEGNSWRIDRYGCLHIDGSGECCLGDSPWLDLGGYINKAELSEGITSITGNAFDECYNLEKVCIPASVTTIADNAFSECRHLMSVEYGGTKAEWDALVKNNPVLKNTPISVPKIDDDELTDEMILDSDITSSKINNSSVSGSTIGQSEIKDSFLGDDDVRSSTIGGGTIRQTDTSETTIDGGNIIGSTISGNSILIDSGTYTTVSGNDVVDSRINESSATDRVIKDSYVSGSTITGGELWYSHVNFSDVTDVENYSSSISGSTITGGKTISGSEFADDIISNHEINGGKIDYSDITNSVVRNAYVSGSDITDSELIDAYVSSSTMTNTVNEGGVSMRSILSGVAAKLEQAIEDVIGNSTFENSRITDSKVTGGTVTDSSVSGSTFNDTELKNNTISSSTLIDAKSNDNTIFDSVLEGITSIGDTVRNSSFVKGIVEAVTAFASGFTGTKVSKGTLFGGSVSGNSVIDSGEVLDADVSESTIKNATVSRSNLTDVEIEDSTVLGGTLKNTTLKNVDVKAIDGFMKITEQPADVAGKLHDTVVLSLAAEGDIVSYKWFYKEEGSSAWTQIGAGNPPFSYEIPEDIRSGMYMGMITDSNGNKLLSHEARLEVTAENTLTVIGGDYQPLSPRKGEIVTITAEERENERFVEWTADEPIEFADKNSSITTFEMPDQNVTITAVFEEVKSYEMSFDANGHGTAPEKITGITAIPADLPEITETGYTFGGWYTTAKCRDDEKAAAGAELTADTVLFAKWTANTYTVTFNAGSGKLPEGEQGEKTVTFGQAYGELPMAQLDDSTFAGWFTEAEGGSQVTAESIYSVADDQTLYAQYISVDTLFAPYVTDSDGNRYDSGSELEEGTKLYITSDNLNAAIYWTDKADEAANIPEVDDRLYKKAIPLEKDVTIYVKAVKQGFKTSATAAFTFKLKNTATDWGDVTEEDRSKYATADDLPSGIWAAGYGENGDVYYTGSAITFDSLHVYYNRTMLRPGDDYTVRYANNTKASTDKSKASVTITGKGNYAGTRKFEFVIKPLSIGDGTTNSDKLLIADVQVEKTGKKPQPATTVTYNLDGKDIVLKKGTDFTYDYSLVGTEAGTYNAMITGKGNYTGLAVFKVTIYEKSSKQNIVKLSFKAIGVQTADGTPKTPEITIMDKKNYYVLGKDDFDALYFNNVAAGTAKVVVTGKGNYGGTKTLSFRITGVPISKAQFSIGAVTYTGEGVLPAYTLKYQASKDAAINTLVQGKDYTVAVANNINKGNGTLTFTGIGSFSGTAKKTFKINPQEFKDGKVSVTCGGSSSCELAVNVGTFAYTKNGVKPDVALYFDGDELVLNRDYKLKYAGNNTVGSIAVITIKGAGNFAGTFKRTFTVSSASLAETTVTVQDIQYTGKAGTFKPVLAVYDTNGVKLAAGKDYDSRSIKYTYLSDTSIRRKEGRDTREVIAKAGSEVDTKKDIIPEGAEIKATVYGKGYYDPASSNSTVFTCVGKLISKAAVKLNKTSFDYTGRKIEISESDFTVKIGKEVIPEGAYRITSITENTKKGTAKVTITGTGSYNGKYYGGSKTVTFKINAKKLNK